MAMCRRVGRSKDKMVRTPLAYGMDFEDVRFKAMDGCTLAAWYIPATRTWSGEMVALLFRWFSSDKAHRGSYSPWTTGMRGGVGQELFAMSAEQDHTPPKKDG